MANVKWSAFPNVGNLVSSDILVGLRAGANVQFNATTVGTVTSVGMSVPSFLSVAGSPITTSGTLAVSYSGTALPVANGGTGNTSFTANQALVTNNAGAIVTSPATIQEEVHVAANGSDTTGNGSILFPYASIGHALSTITDSASTKPYVVRIHPGTYSETGLVIPVWVFLVGDMQQPTKIIDSSGAITISSSAYNSGSQRLGFQDLNLINSTGITIDFQAIGGSGSNDIYINNCQVVGAVTFRGRGSDFLTGNSNQIFGVYTSSGMQEIWFGGYFANTATFNTLGVTNVTAAPEFTGSDFFGNVTFTSSGSGNAMEPTLIASQVSGTLTVDQATTTLFADDVSLNAGTLSITNSGVITYLSVAKYEGYTPSTPGNWSPVPTQVAGALDTLQAEITSIVGSGITSLTGDVVATGPGAAAATIQPNVVTNAKLAQAAADTIKGNNTGSTANVTDLTGSQVTALLSTFVGDTGSGGTKGIIPAPPANSSLSGDFLSASGSWAYVDQSKTIYPNFSLITQGPVPSGSPGTIKYESTTIFTSIVTGKNYAIGVGFIGSPTLTIWDISDQTSPVIVGTFVAAGGGSYNCTVGVVSGVQYAFIGYNSGSHFVVVNLTNLAAPSQTSSTVVTGTPGSIYNVSFLNGYVYCATQSAGLVVMDVGGGTGTPAVPVQTYTQGSPFKSFGVVAIGTNVYTTYFSTSSPFTNRQIISWTLSGAGTPAVPSLLQSLQVTAAGEALGMSISGNTAFVTTAATGAYNINLVDITTPTAMTNLSQINSTNTFDSAFYAVALGNTLYVPSGTNATYGGAIDAYDITIRTTPIHIAQATTGDPNSVFGGIALSGGYIFCADYGVAASNNGYFDVFTQVDANAIINTMLSSTAYIESLTPSTALVSSAGNEVISSITTATELSYVHGATSNIQSQINAISAGVLPWTVETGSISMVKGNGYFANSASPITFTLPTTASVGDTFAASNMNSGNMVIAQNASQTIRYGNEITTTGTGGNITSTSVGDTLTIVCNVVNTGFQVINSQGQLNVT